MIFSFLGIASLSSVAGILGVEDEPTAKDCNELPNFSPKQWRVASLIFSQPSNCKAITLGQLSLSRLISLSVTAVE